MSAWDLTLTFSRIFWRLTSFVFLWQPLAWLDAKLAAHRHTDIGRQIREIRQTIFLVTVLWYTHFYLAAYFYKTQTLMHWAERGRQYQLPVKLLVTLQRYSNLAVTGRSATQKTRLKGTGSRIESGMTDQKKTNQKINVGKHFKKKSKLSYVWIWYLFAAGPHGLIFFLYYCNLVFRGRW